jgi:hypothetical protein
LECNRDYVKSLTPPPILCELVFGKDRCVKKLATTLRDELEVGHRVQQWLTFRVLRNLVVVNALALFHITLVRYLALQGRDLVMMKETLEAYHVGEIRRVDLGHHSRGGLAVLVQLSLGVDGGLLWLGVSGVLIRRVAICSLVESAELVDLED